MFSEVVFGDWSFAKTALHLLSRAPLPHAALEALDRLAKLTPKSDFGDHLRKYEYDYVCIYIYVYG
jgi:hypothetical protein